MPTSAEVHLSGPRYVLGEIEEDHTAIAGLAERAARFKLAMSPQLWGWGTYRRTERSLEDLAVDSGRATLAASGIDPGTIDAVLVCSTFVPGPSEGHGLFMETVLSGLGVGDVPYYGQTLNRCVNLLAALDMARTFVVAGRYQRILVITTDRVVDERERMASFALFCDGAASCVVSADDCGQDAYRLLGCASAQETKSLDWSNEISSDLAREANARLLAPHGVKLGDVRALMHANIFKPLVAMKERQAGYTVDQIHLDNISKYGHCFAADPVVNLVDRAALGHVPEGALAVLATSVPGSRCSALVQKLDH
jgi:3-oxoacyl-[acyl-carrier-protein] synthase-3